MAQPSAKSAISPGSASPDPQTPSLKVVLLGDSGVGKTCLRSQLVHHIFSGAYKATIGADYLTTTLWIPESGVEPGPEDSREEGISRLTSGLERDSDPESDPELGKELEHGVLEYGEHSELEHESNFSGIREHSEIRADIRTKSVDSSGTPKGAFPCKDKDSSKLNSGAARKVCLQVWDTAGQERFNSISQAFYRGADAAVFVYDITNYESLLSVREWFARFMAHCKVTAPAIVIVGNKSDKTSERSVELAEVRDILCRRTNSQAAPMDGHVDWNHDLLEASAKDWASVEAIFRRAAFSSTSHNPEGQSVKEDLIDLNEFPKSSSCAC